MKWIIASVLVLVAVVVLYGFAKLKQGRAEAREDSAKGALDDVGLAQRARDAVRANPDKRKRVRKRFTR